MIRIVYLFGFLLQQMFQYKKRPECSWTEKVILLMFRF
jgi:hypothetical protein